MSGMNDEEMLLGNDQSTSQVSNSVNLIDVGTLVQNLQKPYLFITLKQFADNVTEFGGNTVGLEGNSTFAPMLQAATDTRTQESRMQSMSLAASNFALDSVIHDGIKAAP